MVQHKAPWSEYYNSTPTPFPLHGLDGSLLPWTREVVKTSQRACTARAYLDWRSVKQQERNITTPPGPSPSLESMVVPSHGWERRYLKQAKGPAQQSHILIGEA